MSAYGAIEPEAVPIDDPFWRRQYPRFMNPGAFVSIEETVHRGQRDAGCDQGHLWRYSGETDLVSFMCYAREPDWASLRSIRIEESMTGRPMSLGRITEGLTGWATDDVDPYLAPGSVEPSSNGRYATSLGMALSWTATAVTGGVIGDAAYDLLKVLLGR